jgi:hypothetical protein
LSESLDTYLHDTEITKKLGQEDRVRFQKWVLKIASDPDKISTTVEHALRQALFSEWESEAANHHFKLGSYYPSIVEKCLRQQAYSYLTPETPTHEELAIFSEGKAIHELIAMSLKRSGLISVEGSEIVVELIFDSAKLHGRIDDLLLIRMSDEMDGEFPLYVPLEIKSISSIPKEPKRGHYYQLSTYLLAKDFPFGVLLYWAKREGKIKAFTVQKDQTMYSVLRERVVDLHTSLSQGGMPHKEAALNRDYLQCERCAYLEECNPFLIESIPVRTKVSLFDVDSTMLDVSPRRKKILEGLGLPSSVKIWDIDDEETRQKFWELYNDPKYIELDSLNQNAKEKLYQQVELGRVVIGICPSRKETVEEATRARLANLGLPISHLIVREQENYDTDIKFKCKWALRLARNYDVMEYFDRDAVASSMVQNALQQHNRKFSAN